VTTWVPLYRRPSIRLVLRLAAVVGLALGVQTTILHLSMDPAADVHAYYDAATRLNAGQPLYLEGADSNEPGIYQYPPLLAIAFRPLALLPFNVAAAVWIGILVAAAGLTVRRLGLREPVLLVAGWLALPIMWAMTIGQAEILVTFLLTVGAPWAVALGANLKIFPALAAVYWVGRREWRPLAWFGGVGSALVLAQLLLEPTGTLAYVGFLRSHQVGMTSNVSPFAISPVLWAVFVVALALVALRLAPTRYGWAAAVALAVFATPRVLVYQLCTLLAALREPDPAAAADRDDAGGGQSTAGTT
jgi:hypothetical protein